MLDYRNVYPEFEKTVRRADYYESQRQSLLDGVNHNNTWREKLAYWEEQLSIIAENMNFDNDHNKAIEDRQMWLKLLELCVKEIEHARGWYNKEITEE